MGTALLISTTGMAQETKYKEERDGYELKVKRDGDEYKMKEKGRRPVRDDGYRREYRHKEGKTTTCVKHAQSPKASEKRTVKKSYASGKKCNCKTVAHKSKTKKNSTAYKHKKPAGTNFASASRSTAAARDTVFVTRVDTVFALRDRSSFTGHRNQNRVWNQNVKKFKIKRDGDEIKVKTEYENGDKVIRIFESERELKSYLRSIGR